MNTPDASSQEPPADGLFVSEQHPDSHRWAIAEDDGRSAWLYLTESTSQKPAASCWLYNQVPTPPRFENVRGQTPVVPQTHATENATRLPPDEKSVLLRWSSDGESVAVFFDSDLIGFIARDTPRGFSKHLRVSGPFGNILDSKISDEIFGGAK